MVLFTLSFGWLNNNQEWLETFCCCSNKITLTEIKILKENDNYGTNKNSK